MLYLADRTEPLTVTLAGFENADAGVQRGSAGPREASLGTVPDFGYVGEGVRISGVTPNSAAADAGLIAGDVLLSYNNQPLPDLQSYSNLLRQSAPGDSVQIEVQRGRQTFTVEVVLKAR